MAKALEGIRVLGATRLLSGPYCESLLGDMGAEVLSVELPGIGDENRMSYPVYNGVGTCYLATNRNKKSITINFNKPEGQEIFKELTKLSDIVIENNRPGTMARWGLGYEDLKKINPGIIMASISGYGQYGPYSERAGLDVAAQAMGGLMSFTGMAGGPPLRTGNALSDFMGGVYTAYGILAALHYKEKTGLGQYVDDALADNIMGILENVVPNYDLMGTIPVRDGSRIAWVAPYNCYKATDGHLTIGATTNVLFHRFCDVIGREDLKTDPEFIDPSARVRNVDRVDEMVQAWVGTKTVKEIVDLFAANGIPCSKVNTVVDLVTDPHIKAREMFVEVEYPGVGKFRVAGVTPKLSLTPGKVETPPPTIGQHNDEIYRGLLKYSDEKINVLRSIGAI